MKLLVIICEFPPTMSPRAYRWGAIAEEFAGAGHDVDVVCSCRPGMTQTEFAGVHVHRVGATWLEALREKRGGGPPTPGRGAPPDLTCDADPRSSLTSRWLAAAYYGLWKPLYWPDAQCLFVLPALRAATRLLRTRRYDALITVSLPFSSHVVGLRLKRRFPNVPWLVDIGDPFALLHEVPLNNHRLYRRLNYRVEAAVLRAADAIAVTTAGAEEQYRDAFSVGGKQFSVIPPLMSLPPVQARGGPRANPPSDWLRMVYCGRLYRNIRSPRYLLEMLRHLIERHAVGKRLELHIYGGIGDCGDLIKPHADLIGKHLFLHGHVDRDAVSAAMAEADALVNIGNATAHQVPSKIIEYIAHGKPIVNLVSHSKDCTLELLERHPAVLTLWSTADSAADSAARAARFFESLPPAIAEERLAQLRAPFMPPVIAAQYLELIEQAQGASRLSMLHPAEDAASQGHLPRQTAPRSATRLRR